MMMAFLPDRATLAASTRQTLDFPEPPSPKNSVMVPRSTPPPSSASSASAPVDSLPLTRSRDAPGGFRAPAVALARAVGGLGRRRRAPQPVVEGGAQRARVGRRDADLEDRAFHPLGYAALRSA